MIDTQLFPRGVEIITGTIIRNKEGKILLVKNPKWKDWLIPGGHVEPGETIMEAAIREVKEETGLSVRPIAILDFQEVINSKDFHRPAHFISFHCLLETGDDEAVTFSREVTEYKWFSIEEALQVKLVEGVKKTLRQYVHEQHNIAST